MLKIFPVVLVSYQWQYSRLVNGCIIGAAAGWTEWCLTLSDPIMVSMSCLASHHNFKLKQNPK